MVERVQYEADQARIRYMRVDPSNRLVADTLEALWNDKLRQLDQGVRITSNGKAANGQLPSTKRRKSSH